MSHTLQETYEIYAEERGKVREGRKEQINYYKIKKKKIQREKKKRGRHMEHLKKALLLRISL